MKGRVYILGGTGMLGNYVNRYLKSKGFNVSNIPREWLNANTSNFFEEFVELGIKDGDVVINCIGLIKQREGLTKIDYITVNSYFPLHLAKWCNITGAKLIHVSTDCVYDGLGGDYDETAVHNATDLYGISKSLGEPEDCTVIRTSIIGEEKRNKLSLVEWVKSQKGGTANGYTNHIWNGITCLQFAKVVEQIITTDGYWEGVRHIYSEKVDKNELVSMINEIYNLGIVVTPVEGPYSCDRSMSSIHDITHFGIPSLRQQIIEMKEFGIE